MRQKTRKPIDEMQVDQVTLDANSRDDIPQLLKGLQYIFLNPILLEQVLKILDGILPINSKLRLLQKSKNRKG